MEDEESRMGPDATESTRQTEGWGRVRIQGKVAGGGRGGVDPIWARLARFKSGTCLVSRVWTAQVGDRGVAKWGRRCVRVGGREMRDECVKDGG
jgi:hypothetical protein